MREVTVPDMLEARDARVRLQKEMLERHRLPVISFSMNIAGPVKDSPLIRRAFGEGLRLLEASGLHIADRAEKRAFTGCEAVFAVDGGARRIKEICMDFEDLPGLGRLFDMDVIGPDGEKFDRAAMNREERGCIVCGKPGRGCASRRLHPAQEIQAVTLARMEEYFRLRDRERVGRLASESLLGEVMATPKPGLVDQRNSGSHRDMDIATFRKSIAALESYWPECMRIGQETAQLSPEETFLRLREAGKRAEQDMLRATGGVNTHKGAVFTLGVICGAAGRLWRAEEPCRNPEMILDECARMTSRILTEEIERIRTEMGRATAGQRLLLEHGITGVRGEMIAGLPSVKSAALPALKSALAGGMSENDAAVVALIHLIACTADTNMISRGGVEAARQARGQARALIETGITMEAVQRLDDEYIRKNLSPGGCADLLAAALFLLKWELG